MNGNFQKSGKKNGRVRYESFPSDKTKIERDHKTPTWNKLYFNESTDKFKTEISWEFLFDEFAWVIRKLNQVSGSI